MLLDHSRGINILKNYDDNLSFFPFLSESRDKFFDTLFSFGEDLYCFNIRTFNRTLSLITQPDNLKPLLTVKRSFGRLASGDKTHPARIVFRFDLCVVRSIVVNKSSNVLFPTDAIRSICFLSACFISMFSCRCYN